MAQIIIDSSELTYLENKVKELEQRLQQSQDRLSSISEYELISKCTRLSGKICEEVLTIIAKNLGFDRFDLMLDLKKDFMYKSSYGLDANDYTVTIGANVSSKVKVAFMEIGIKTDEPKFNEGYISLKDFDK